MALLSRDKSIHAFLLKLLTPSRLYPSSRILASLFEIPESSWMDFMKIINQTVQEHPILVDKYLMGREVEVDGVFDDCQALVKQAFMDDDLCHHMKLTSANSINVARFLPQAFYYFHAYAQLKRMGMADNFVVCVPSGNFGNITAAIFARQMGLPIKRFIAANNANDVVCQYLQTGNYAPRPSVQTIANAMDVGDPSNFARISDLFHADWQQIRSLMSGAAYTDEQIRHTMRHCYEANHYVLDPHGACAYQALKDLLADNEVGVFGETAHPAKFKETVESAINAEIDIPERLAAFMKGKKQSVSMSKKFSDFKQLLMAE